MKRESKVARERVRGSRLAANPEEEPSWTFLTNHAHVLLCIARDSEMVLREVAVRVGITERAVQRIVSELEEAGYLVRERDGRRNRYEVRGNLPLRHPIERHCQIATLIEMVRERRPSAKRQSGGGAEG